MSCLSVCSKGNKRYLKENIAHLPKGTNLTWLRALGQYSTEVTSWPKECLTIASTIQLNLISKKIAQKRHKSAVLKQGSPNFTQRSKMLLLWHFPNTKHNFSPTIVIVGSYVSGRGSHDLKNSLCGWEPLSYGDPFTQLCNVNKSITNRKTKFSPHFQLLFNYSFKFFFSVREELFKILHDFTQTFFLAHSVLPLQKFCILNEVI